MRATTLLQITHLVALSWAGCEDNANGFASLNGGTTGGNGGTVVRVTTQAQLEQYASAAGKYVIKIPGKITITPTGKEISVENDKTIIGEGALGEIYGGGFRIIEKHNVIIRNLRIGNTAAGAELDWDGIQADTSTNIWIDHCVLELVGDGGVDLRKDSNYYTVSNTWFKGINKAFGIGWTENVISQGTIHHNYFDGTTQRNPSADNMKYAHLYNNYLRGVTSYGHYARGSTNARVENVFFESCKDPLTKDSGAILTAIGNTYQSTTGTIAPNAGTSFNPASYYSYTLDATKDIPTLVKNNVGPRASVCPPAGTTLSTTTTSKTAASTTSGTTRTTTGAAGTVPQWGQCGGSGYTGPTTCVTPYTCQYSSEWYSQCL